MGTISYSIPQAGQLNSTEDPKIATALQTLLTLLNGNIDVVNLSAAAQTALGASGAWQTLTLATNVAAATGTYVPAARLVGDKVELRGAMVNNGTAITNATIFTVPVALKPASNVILTAVQEYQSVTASVAYPLLLLAAGGTAKVASTGDTSFANSAIISLEGLRYSLS